MNFRQPEKPGHIAADRYRFTGQTGTESGHLWTAVAPTTIFRRERDGLKIVGENPSEPRCRVNKISGGFRNFRLKPQHPARAALVLP